MAIAAGAIGRRQSNAAILRQHTMGFNRGTLGGMRTTTLQGAAIGGLRRQAIREETLNDLDDAGGDEALGDHDGHDWQEYGAITEIQLPGWLQDILIILGITDLQNAIREERERRRDEKFNNPWPEVSAVVTSTWFEIVVGGVIVVNSVLIGWEASIEEDSMGTFFSIFEHFFTAFFFFEWILRILAFGWVWAFELANFLDSVLVFGTGVLLKWVAEPMNIGVGALRIFTVLRTLRLVRLAHVVRLEPGFKEMWILIHGLTTCVRPLTWTLIIATCVLYVFSIAATEIIGRAEVFRENDLAQELFGNFGLSMFTMVQLMTMDTGFDLVCRPLMKTQPALALFFVFFVMVGVFIVMNLITAIIVSSAREIANEDKDGRAKEADNAKRAELKTLADIFLELDDDHSGTLSFTEFISNLNNKKVKQQLQLLEMKVEELKETWDILDPSEESTLNIKEFTDGMRRMKGEAKAKDVAEVIKRLKETSVRHKELQKLAKKYTETLRGLEQDTARIADDTAEVVSMFHEMYHRLEVYQERAREEDKFLQGQERTKTEAEEVKEEENPEGSGSEEDDDDDEDEEGEDDELDELDELDEDEQLA